MKFIFLNYVAKYNFAWKKKVKNKDLRPKKQLIFFL